MKSCWQTEFQGGVGFELCPQNLNSVRFSQTFALKKENKGRFLVISGRSFHKSIAPKEIACLPVLVRTYGGEPSLFSQNIPDDERSVQELNIKF